MSYSTELVADGGTGNVIMCSPKSDNFKLAFMITPSGASATVTVEVCLQPFRKGEVPDPVRWVSFV